MRTPRNCEGEQVIHKWRNLAENDDGPTMAARASASRPFVPSCPRALVFFSSRFLWLILLCSAISFPGCRGGHKGIDEDPGPAPNPPAAGFNFEDSDQRAMDIADRVMEEMGGRDDWDRTRYITWNFFGRRTHIWEKNGGDDRIEFTDQRGQRYVILMNVNSRDGRVFRDGVELINPSERHEWLRRGYEMWVNDSYWLVMPYKLKDTGVTLTYKGESTMNDGRYADVLQLTFQGVGVTPDNKYDVYVAKDSHLVEQWSYYRDAADAQPAVTTPWSDWKWHGEIMLSGDRGERQITDIVVLTDVPMQTFTSPDPVDVSGYTAPVVDPNPNR